MRIIIAGFYFFLSLQHAFAWSFVEPSQEINRIKYFNSEVTQFKQRIFDNYKIKNVRYINSNFTGAFFSASSFENFSFRNSNFSGTRIVNSKFIGGDFIEVDFSDSFITDTNFYDCILPANISTKAILINVKFKNCQFQ